MGKSAQVDEPSAQELISVVHELNRCGWCVGTGGNFSLAMGREPLRLLITPSGRDKASLGQEDLVLVDEEADPISGASRKPSAETLLHCIIAKHREAGAVLHTHSIWNTLLSERFLAKGKIRLTGYEMLKGLSGVVSHEEEITVPILENSQNIPSLSKKILSLLREDDRLHGFLIAGHGLYTWGRDLETAHRHVEIFEFLFELVGRRTTFQAYEG